MPIDPAPAQPRPYRGPLSKLPGFDPRAVPVVGIDSHLPAVPPQRLHADALRERFRRPPAWEPEIRQEARFTDREPADASVLVPIVLHEEPTVLLTERTTHLSTHSGQVAFPGGRRDATDPDAAHTAMREAQEEIGLPPQHVEVLGTLPVYLTGTMFHVTPVVALVRPGARLEPNPHEVAAVFEVPLRFLMNPAHHRRHRIEVDGWQREWLSMPYVDAGTERFIWGATAAMLRNFYRFLAA